MKILLLIAFSATLAMASQSDVILSRDLEKNKTTPQSPARIDDCGDTAVANVLFPGDAAERYGCTSSESSPGNAYDGSTNSFECLKGSNDRNSGIVILKNDNQSSIVERLRVYANSDCPECDPIKYKVEGRGGPNCIRINNKDEELGGIIAQATVPWKLIHKGVLPWSGRGSTPGRNQAGEEIKSSYASGDENKSFTEVSLENYGDDGPAECRDYRISFDTRVDTAATPIKFGELELVGRVSVCPTLSPVASVTTSPSVSPRPSISSIPTPVPSISSAPSCSRTEVATVLYPDDSVETFGCTNSESSPGNAYDGTTNNFECAKDPADQDKRKHGIIISNTYRPSIVERLRVYANSDCPECDPIEYKVEGRGGPNCIRINNKDEELGGIIAQATVPWKLIHKGRLPWSGPCSTPGRNQAGEEIKSDYVSGDGSKSFTEVSLRNYGDDGPAECRDYRITFTYTRFDDVETPVKFGELELVGRVGDCATSPPTNSPALDCSVLRRKVCRKTSGCKWKKKECRFD